MSDTDIRVRFAPSPTGFLHVGGARTALYNWLFARHTGGKFLLRIEDTDRQRSSGEHVRVIKEGLAWLGLDYDEEIVFQGEGVARHQQLAEHLLQAGSAYEDEGALRFRMPEGEIAWDDKVHGPISFQGADIKDWIILRSDKSPTYNFTVVTDDIEMGITHVMRGDDHISNTPKQIAVYQALDREPPAFVHVPMIHGPDGKKLSKRHGATAVGEYRRMGILPGAMRNFLALLGWSAGDERELYFSLDELIQVFSLAGLQKKAAVFDLTKLYWMNGQHVSRTDPGVLFSLITDNLKDLDLDIESIDRMRLLRAVEVNSERARSTLELAERVALRFDARRLTCDAKARKFIEKDRDGFKTALLAVEQRLNTVPDDVWEAGRLDTSLRDLASELGLGVGKVFQPIRIAITGTTVSEPANVLLEVVGKDQSIERIKTALGWPEASSAP